jgi:uncharacterized protein YutE (UPF0331/DUF86 family)
MRSLASHPLRLNLSSLATLSRRRARSSQDAVGMSLLVAVQDALDIALHMASDEGWGVPASYADSFTVLASHGVIDAPLATDWQTWPRSEIGWPTAMAPWT